MGILLVHAAVAAIAIALFTGTLSIKVEAKLPKARPSGSGNHPPVDLDF